MVNNNMRVIYKYVLLIAFLTLNSCTQKMDIKKFSLNEPKLVLEDYFSGSLEAWGLFHDRFGNLKRQFRVKIVGKINDQSQLVLDESFLYDDGETENRVWTIDILGDGKYEGRADDVIGVANGIAEGNALNWKYELLLNVKDNKIKVSFDDWMFLQDRNILINRAEVKKFGINIGVVTITFLKTN